MTGAQFVVPAAVAVGRDRADLTVVGPRTGGCDGRSSRRPGCAGSRRARSRSRRRSGTVRTISISTGPSAIERSCAVNASPGPSNWNRHIGGSRSKNVFGANRSSSASKSEKQRWNSALSRSAVVLVERGRWSRLRHVGPPPVAATQVVCVRALTVRRCRCARIARTPHFAATARHGVNALLRSARPALRAQRRRVP